MAAAEPQAAGLAEPAAGGPRPQFGKPWAWLAFALVLVAVPLVGLMVQAGMTWTEMHPAINAVLNGASTVFLIAGWLAIRGRRIDFHRACMVSAFATSTIFLASYLTRFALTGAHRYPGDGWDRTVYLVVLASHSLLAALAVPLILRALWLGWKDRRAAHRRLARWTLPIWLYVSVTGVAVYLLLYQLGPALAAP
jgi:putative membrane protein